MSLPNILEEAKMLKPQEKYIIIEELIKSLNKPNEEIDKIWLNESIKRMEAYKNNNVQTFSYQDVFKK